MTMPEHLRDISEAVWSIDGPWMGVGWDMRSDWVTLLAWCPLTREEEDRVLALGPAVRVEVEEPQEALLAQPFGPRSSSDGDEDVSWLGLTEAAAEARAAAEGQWLRVRVRDGVGMSRTADDKGASRLNLALVGGRVVDVRRF